MAPRDKLPIFVNRDTAPLMLELLTRAAVTGPQAAQLATLYTQAKAAADALAPPAPKAKGDAP